CGWGRGIVAGVPFPAWGGVGDGSSAASAAAITGPTNTREDRWMKLTPYRWAGLAAGFVLLLLYATVVSLPSPPPTGVEHDAESAGHACAAAVRERVPDARFPFAANAAYLGEARYRLNGQVD